MRGEAEPKIAYTPTGRAGIGSLIGQSEGPDRIVPCGGCGIDCTITAVTWEFAKRASEICLLRGWQVLAPNEITRCGPCGDKWRTDQVDRSAAIMLRVSQAIQHAKEHGVWPSHAREWMIANGYYESVKGVEDGWLAKKAAGNGPRRKGSL